MNEYKNISAFTIIEASITLAIMGIISSMVYFIYISLIQQSYLYSKTKIINFEYHQLDNLIREDFFISKETLLLNNNTFELILEDFSTIRYEVIDNSLYRTYNNQQEKFNCHITAYDFGGIVKNIPKAMLTYKLFNEDIQCIYYKNYGTSGLINKEYLNEY